jgi:hypothetical protein
MVPPARGQTRIVLFLLYPQTRVWEITFGLSGLSFIVFPFLLWRMSEVFQ